MLVTTDRRDPAGRLPGERVRPRRPEAWIGESYVVAVRAAGGLPLLIAPGEAIDEALLALADAMVITGGHFDIHPRWYGEEPTGRLDRVDEDRTGLELGLCRQALDEGIPVLGVCGGMQALAVAAGGTLVQDLPREPLDHEQPTDPATPWHPVRIDAPADRWLGPTVQANSTHHQAVRDPGALVACGWTEDGVIEVVAHPDHPFALGVQWHPELLGDHRPYRALVTAARAAIRKPDRER